MTKNAGYILAIDAGTGSGRAVLFDSRGSQVAVAQEEWTHKSDPRYPNSMEFDVIHNWELLCRCIRNVCRQGRISPPSIAAVSATSMREGIVLYNGEGKELWGCANVDARAANEVRFLKEQFPGLEEKFYRISGQTFALGALPRLLWVKNFMPEAYEQIAKISMLSDWVLFRLCGEIATDPSNGGTSGIYSLADRNWVPEMARTVGLRHDIFPPSVESGTIIGKVTTQAARDTGLPKGLPVVMGGGDVQLGCVGLGVVRPSQTAILGRYFLAAAGQSIQASYGSENEYPGQSSCSAGFEPSRSHIVLRRSHHAMVSGRVLSARGRHSIRTSHGYLSCVGRNGSLSPARLPGYHPHFFGRDALW